MGRSQAVQHICVQLRSAAHKLQPIFICGAAKSSSASSMATQCGNSPPSFMTSDAQYWCALIVPTVARALFAARVRLECVFMYRGTYLSPDITTRGTYIELRQRISQPSNEIRRGARLGLEEVHSGQDGLRGPGRRSGRGWRIAGGKQRPVRHSSNRYVDGNRLRTSSDCQQDQGGGACAKLQRPRKPR